MKLFASLLVASLSIPAVSQITGRATVKGNCSQAVTGSNNTFNIKCSVDPIEGKKIVLILNKMLANQIDASAVMGKLDEILAATKSASIDQRAWISSIQASGAMRPGQPFNVLLTGTNTGRTPASQVTIQVSGRALRAGTRPNLEDLPGIGSVAVIAPNEPIRVRFQLNHGDPIHQGDYRAEVSGEKDFFVYGRINYQDTSGMSHYTTFCSILNRDATGFTRCDFGNTMDAEKH